VKTIHKQITDFDLERYLLDELPSDHKQWIYQQLITDHVLKKRLDQLEQSNHTLLKRYPQPQVTQEITKRYLKESTPQPDVQSKQKMPRLSPWATGLSLCATLIVILSVTPFMEPNNLLQQELESLADHSNDGIRFKGITPQLRVYRDRGHSYEQLQSKALSRAHDRLQLSYIAGGQTYGVIFSIDGNHVVTLHHPSTLTKAAKLNPNGEITLATAYELDDAPDFEAFFLVTSQSPFPINEVLSKAKILAESLNHSPPSDLPLSQGFKQTSIVIKKTNKIAVEG